MRCGLKMQGFLVSPSYIQLDPFTRAQALQLIADHLSLCDYQSDKPSHMSIRGPSEADQSCSTMYMCLSS